MKQPEPPAAFQSNQFGYAAMPSAAPPSFGAQSYAQFDATPPQQLQYAQYAQQPAASPAAGGAPAEAAQSNSEIPVGALLGIPIRVHVLLPAGAHSAASYRARAAHAALCVAVTVLYTLNAWLIRCVRGTQHGSASNCAAH